MDREKVIVRDTKMVGRDRFIYRDRARERDDTEYFKNHTRYREEKL